MKRIFAIVGILTLAALFIGGMTFEDKFTIKMYQWAGLDSDEPFSLDMLKPNDMWNMEVGNEGGKTYIQQRRGMRRILNNITARPINTKAVFICQINGDSERVITYGNQNVYRATADEQWVNMTPAGTASDTAVGMILFKDTLIVPIGDTVYIFAVPDTGTSGLANVRRDVAENYNGILLHQDRVYRWGTNKENNTEITWMPEFDIYFKTSHFDSMVALGTAGSAFIDRDEGDFLTNVLSHGEHIMAYKSRSIYKILVSPTANKPVEIIRFAENVGAYGYGAVVAYNNSHYFVAEDGVYENNGASVQKISDAIDYWFTDSLTHSRGTAVIFKIEAFDKKLFVTLPKRSADGNESNVDGYRTFVYEFDTGVWAKFRLSPHDGAHTEGGSGGQEQHWMLRYERNPFCGTPLTGTQYLKQRLIVVRDSTEANTSAGQVDRHWIYPDDRYYSDGGDTLTDGTYGASSYTTALTPLTNMWTRKEIERVIIYGEARVGAADSAKGNVLYLNNEDGVIDSILFTITSSPFFINKRFSTVAAGDMIGIKLEIRDTNHVKINALELVGMEKGMGDED